MRLATGGREAVLALASPEASMSLISGLSLAVFTVPALSASPSQGTQRTNIRSEAVSDGPGSPALFAWADFDGNGRLDLAAVGADGRLQLFASASESQFEDVTEQVGVAGIANAVLVIWGDYDNDLRLDLFVGAREGESRLFHNEGGTFVDMSAASGLRIEGGVRSAHWLDEDGDGRLDLHVVTAEKHLLLRGLEGGFFAETELPPTAASSSEVELGSAEGNRLATSLGTSHDDGRTSGKPTSGGSAPAGGLPTAPTAGGRVAPTPPSSLTVDPPMLLGLPLACATSIKDQATPGSCLEASTTPTLGSLHPISANLFVATSGNVGIGTTSPSAKLDVAGTARMSDTLTLAPSSGDQALHVSSGSIYMGGALFIHTKGGPFNAALGREALASPTTGSFNAASGYRALFSNTTGSFNTADGAQALLSNTTGAFNTASGANALSSNTTGIYNTASGFRALASNTTGSRNTANGYQALSSNTTASFNTACGHQALRANTTGTGNTAIGYRALRSNTTGYYNIAIGPGALNSNTTGSFNIAIGGRSAGAYVTTGSSNIHIGTYGYIGDSATTRIGTAQSRAFIAGIRGATVNNGIPVLVGNGGQLGTVSSSRRFKEEIRDMGDLTERLLKLRPVVFRYKPEVQAGERPLEYGLIAEEVAAVFPELVVDDNEGKPFTIKYHLLSSMLLNELEKLHETVETQETRHARDLNELRTQLEKRITELEARAVPATLPSSAELATTGE
jgi:hypothetical protein